VVVPSSLAFRRAPMKSRSARGWIDGDGEASLFETPIPLSAGSRQPFVGGACAPMPPIRGQASLAPDSVCPAVPAPRSLLHIAANKPPFLEDGNFRHYARRPRLRAREGKKRGREKERERERERKREKERGREGEREKERKRERERERKREREREKKRKSE